MLYPNGTTTEPRVSDNYGPRTPFQTSNGNWTSSFHYGVDYVGIGTIRAVGNGIVREAGVVSGWEGAGRQVLIEHDGYWSRSFHLDSVSVSVGQSVSQGQAIGQEGSTGNVTGRHLHLQIHVGGNQNGNAVGPRDFIAARLGGGSGAALNSNQRQVGSEPANRRIGAASTSAPNGEQLAAHEIGDFKGWVRGESVSGNNVWFVGAYSGDYFWSGGFTSQSTAGLADLTPTAPVALAAHQRRVTPGEPANRRIGAPNTQAPTGTALAPQEVGDFKGWVRGESVSGNNVWFVGAYSGDFFWSGGFEGAANTTGLADLNTATPTPPVTPPVIVGATSRTPVYPKAKRGWSVPLGQESRDAGSTIDRFIIHHTTNTGSDEEFFKTKNSRGSAPTWYVLSNGDVVETIDPGKRPSATGSANTRSVAVETQNTSGDPTWGISTASHESIAQLVAWFYSTYNGKTLGGFPVDISLDRTHIIGHSEAGVNATLCPGPSMRLDWIVDRAKEIVAGTTPDDTVPVSKTWLQKLMDDLKKLLSGK